MKLKLLCYKNLLKFMFMSVFKHYFLLPDEYFACPVTFSRQENAECLSEGFQEGEIFVGIIFVPLLFLYAQCSIV